MECVCIGCLFMFVISYVDNWDVEGIIVEFSFDLDVLKIGFVSF